MTALERLPRLVREWGGAVAMMAGIFLVSAMPQPPALPGRLTDTTAHVMVYATLAAAMVRGVAGARWSGVSASGAMLAALLAAAYGLTDEFHQSFVPGRTAEARDVAADAVGAVIGAGLVWGLSNIVLAVRARSDAH